MQSHYTMSLPKKKLLIEDPDKKPYIVYNEYLQVWVGLRDGGRTALFSDEYNEAKPLYYEQQFKTLQRIAGGSLEKEYL
jgi:hypothetical protein